MNILHLEASPGWGGQEIRILREAEGMRKRGHLVILAISRGGGLAIEARKLGFLVYECNFQKRAWFFTFATLIRILLRHKIDIVNTHSSLDSWLGGIAARLMRVPIVRTRHLSTPIRAGVNSRVLYGYLADFVVTTCAAVIPMIVNQSKKPLYQVRSIPTGVDPEKMQCNSLSGEDFRSSLGISQKVFLVGTACFMRSWKGLFDFLEAAHLLSDIADLRWVIIGGGHELEYRNRAKELGLMDRVYFTGHLSNPISAIQSLDAFALLSTAHEGVSQAIIQAAYLSKPLIATPVGGLNEVCLDGVTGIVVKPFSPGEVAKAVLTLMNDANRCQNLGAQAKKRVLEHFLLNKTLNEMEDTYNQVLLRRINGKG